MKKGERFKLKPLPFSLHSDPELKNSTLDPLKYSMLYNHVASPKMKTSTLSWHGSREISVVLYQIIIEMYSSPGQLVVDIIASTGASARACQASGHHFFGFERDKEIYDALLMPLCDASDSGLDEDDNTDEDPRASKNDWVE